MMLDPIVENLRGQIDLHEILLSTLREETSLSAFCPLETLLRLQERKNEIVEQIRDHEEKRLQYLEKCRSSTGTHKDIRLTELLELCDDSMKKVLNDCREKLLSIVEEIQRSGKEIAEKAASRLHSITAVQNAVHKAFYRPVIYSNQGTLTSPNGACLMRHSI